MNAEKVPTSERAAPHPAEILLSIEESARNAPDLIALAHIVANEARKIVKCGQIHVFQFRHNRAELRAVSSLSNVDRTAPFVQDLEQAIGHFGKSLKTPTAYSIDDLRRSDPNTLVDAAYAFYCLCPLFSRTGDIIGLMLAARSESWRDSELKLLEHLCGAFSHSWAALLPKKSLARLPIARRWVIATGCITALVVSLFPVPLTALAPCEIVPLDAEIVSAPLDGILRSIAVEPNQSVEAGQLLLSFVDTTIKGRLDIAERSLEVAATRNRRLQQAAFDDRNARRDLAISTAELQLAIVERDAAAELLQRTRVMASRSGIAIFSSRKDFEGRPVSTGEKIMQIADPDRVQLRIDMPVKDASAVHDRGRVRVYLDSDPLRPIEAKLERVSYHASTVPGGALAFVLYAQFDTGITPRIGFRGTAQVYGDDVPLFYYVFRRPITAFRQTFGI